MLAGLHSRNLVLGIKRCRITTLIVDHHNIVQLLRSDIVPRKSSVYMNFLSKTFDRRDRKPNFVIFVVWNALIVSEWVVLAWRESLIWSRLKSHLMCYWLHSRMGDAGLVQDFIFLFWMLIKGMWRRVKLIYLKELVESLLLQILSRWDHFNRF